MSRYSLRNQKENLRGGSIRKLEKLSLETFKRVSDLCDSNSDCSDNQRSCENSPRKQKSKISEDELCELSPRTPEKQHKFSKAQTNCTTPNRKLKNENVQTPSTLLKKLELNSPEQKKNDEISSRKSLFHQDLYYNARKSLHSTAPSSMPCRDKEISELRLFIKKHLENKSSGTLYISGPPGTGKTASLSLILNDEHVLSEFNQVYVNCTSIKSSGSVYARIVKELEIKTKGTGEKECLTAIEKYLTKNHKMILLVLDEIDQLDSKKQSVLYTIFEWSSKPNSKLVLIGIANALDLTDRILPRLQARCELKPKLMHFAPYSKQEIMEIFKSRLEQGGASEAFTPVGLQLLAGKVASVSGDIRRALDIGRRVTEIVEQDQKKDVLKSIDNLIEKQETMSKSADLKEVVKVLNSVYGTSQALDDEVECAFPLQQKIIICTLLLFLKKAKNKDITIGKLHDVYKRVCTKMNLFAVDQAEFVGLCSLIETKGIIKISGKKEPRMYKVSLEWDEQEVTSALKDKRLISNILQDTNALGKY